MASGCPKGRRGEDLRLAELPRRPVRHRLHHDRLEGGAQHALRPAPRTARPGDEGDLRLGDACAEEEAWVAPGPGGAGRPSRLQARRSLAVGPVQKQLALAAAARDQDRRLVPRQYRVGRAAEVAGIYALDHARAPEPAYADVEGQ